MHKKGNYKSPPYPQMWSGDPPSQDSKLLPDVAGQYQSINQSIMWASILRCVHVACVLLPVRGLLEGISGSPVQTKSAFPLCLWCFRESWVATCNFWRVRCGPLLCTADFIICRIQYLLVAGLAQFTLHCQGHAQYYTYLQNVMYKCKKEHHICSQNCSGYSS